MGRSFFCCKLFFVIYSNIFFLVQSFDPCNKEEFELVGEITDAVNICGPDHFLKLTGNSVHGCLPMCEKNYNSAGPMLYCDVKDKGCPPGYICKKFITDYRCEIDEDSCFKYVVGGQNNAWFKSQWKPDCNADGTWKAKQCKPNAKSGRCFCFNKVGRRIYGQAFAENAGNMTCACSRTKAESMGSGTNVYNSLHCDSVGNYEPLQCNEGQCWCVEPESGNIKSKIVPERLMNYLPCYSKELNGDRYLRQCESEEYGKANVVKELKVHGNLFANLPHILCDFDGSYGIYAIGTSEVRCTWKDKTDLGFGVSLRYVDFKSVTCNCARDKKIYELAGMKLLLHCGDGGEYDPLQTTEDGEHYCVDTDGHRKTKNIPNPDVKECEDTKQ